MTKLEISPGKKS